MKYPIFSIQDTLIGFNAPYIMINEKVAEREYTNVMKKEKNSIDMRLFKIGTFDDETGEITTEIPKMILGGIENE